MKLIKPLMLGGLLAAMTSCQTAPLPEPLDVPKLQREAVAGAKAEWCRGQEPLQAFHPAAEGEELEPVTFDEIMAAASWVRAYIGANNAQWEEACEEAVQP